MSDPTTRGLAQAMMHSKMIATARVLDPVFDERVKQMEQHMVLNWPHHGPHRHYKGGIYRVIAHATDEATGQPVVVYRSEQDGRMWVRTLENWNETVHGEENGKAVRIERFTRHTG